MITLNLPSKLAVLSLTGVQTAQLSGNKVRGKYDTTLTEYGSTGDFRLIETFLNWPNDPDGILRFTRMYGPLQEKPTAGAKFEFQVSEFRGIQRKFRQMWRNLRKKTVSPLDILNELGGVVRFHAGLVTYVAPTLYAYLYADLMTSPKERVRVCKRRECSNNPYFIARHLNQEFCSHECAELAKRAWNKEWWQKRGQAWRAKRRDDEIT
jgi:hypothetical protein